ncbi:2-oxo acid dehydrogenase subunit E2 [Haladaptatus sp. ZSTT2]|uniref:2-oxo acid dehydrogenase subunit E2 n=1 Tax=Haladaptatus sp. ZSTT2 TaxID=3120515 RepID=UPI00300F6FCC
MDTRGERVEPFSLRRRATVDSMRMAGRRSDIHGLVEFDVTDARTRIDELEHATGERLSFTAFIVFCLAQAIDAQPHVQAYRDALGRVVRFDDVDVMVIVETTVSGERIGVPHVIRAANRRSLHSIHREIRRAQTTSDVPQFSRFAPLFFRLPGVLRRQIYRLPRLAPRRWKQLAGTVGVSAVGMFGAGGGWGITPTNYPLQLTLGGISTKPGVKDGDIEIRDYLSVTATFDHDVVDGAPAARFLTQLKELVESAHGLDTIAE